MVNDHPESYGQNEDFVLIDRYRIWNLIRKIKYLLKNEKIDSVCDIGCGYNAIMLGNIIPNAKEKVGIDFKNKS